MLYVFDASALLAIVLVEDRALLIGKAADTGVIGSVNLAEAVTVLARKGFDVGRIDDVMRAVAIPVLSADAPLAIDAGLLWPITKHAGSSLGDRYALALARRLGAALVTSDMRLASVAPLVGVAVLALRQDSGAGSAR